MSSSNLPMRFKATCFKTFSLKNKDQDYSNTFLEAIQTAALKSTALAMTKCVKNESGIYLLAMDNDDNHIQVFHHTSLIPSTLRNNIESKWVSLVGFGSTALSVQIVRDSIRVCNRIVPNWLDLWESSNTSELRLWILFGLKSIVSKQGFQFPRSSYKPFSFALRMTLPVWLCL